MVLVYMLAVISLFAAGCQKKNETYQKKTTQSTSIIAPPELLPVRQFDREKVDESKNISRVRVEKPDVKSARVSSVTDIQKSDVAVEALRVQSPAEKVAPYIRAQDQLSLACINKANRELFVVLFYYTKLRSNAYWRWIKSPVMHLEKNEITKLPIKAAEDLTIKGDIFGYLGVFETEEEAVQATYENLSDDKKIDLDRLIELQGTSVEIVVDHYGIHEEQFDYKIRTKEKETVVQPELDFVVENKTGKPVLITCFVYQKDSDQDSFVPWKYDKTEVQRVEPGESIVIDVETIKELYDWIYMRGFLAIFEVDQEQEALDATYELLQPEQKLALGRLADVIGKKITLVVEQYGPAKKIFEFQQSKLRTSSVRDKKLKPRSIF